MCVLIFSTTSSEARLKHVWSTSEARLTQQNSELLSQMYWGLHVKYLSFLSILVIFNLLAPEFYI